MLASVSIGHKQIGRGHRCFVIAEVGVNHNGNVALAHELVDAAAQSGADAVKFQTFTPELLAAADAPQAEYQRAGGSGSTQIELLRDLALDAPAHAALRDHAAEVGLIFLSTPFDSTAVELLERLGVVAYKVSSGDLTNHPLLDRVAATGKPVLLSTGMSTLEEVAAAVARLGDAARRLVLMHCVSSYPADPADCNLLAMETMRARFERPVGWSDHTVGPAVAIGAAALGAEVIEKHLTLDRSLAGPDHRASIEPADFRAMVDGIRAVEAARGESIKAPTDAERTMATVARRSLHWARALEPGDRPEAEDLAALRPGTGIAPSRLGEFLGREVRRATSRGALVTEEDFAPGQDMGRR